MAKRMLIDATHPEQTRVAVVDGQRLLEFDFESTARKQLKGNIYLAKVIRIEPSLQAAFVEYGGNRHGFLAFSEIHHDYYRIPMADRQALEDAMADAPQGAGDIDQPFSSEDVSDDMNAPFNDEEVSEDHISHSALPPAVSLSSGNLNEPMLDPFSQESQFSGESQFTAEGEYEPEGEQQISGYIQPVGEIVGGDIIEGDVIAPVEALNDGGEAEIPFENVGGDEVEGHREQRRHRFIRRYKIQEVIKRGQIMLIQVVKEERGNKGAALTTYISLAGRYCVLMPNTDKGGGISRKITSMQDRRRMKDLLEDLDTPDGMAVILRTAGMERSKIEVRRDLEYLLRLWDSIRELTLKSVAPSLVYEEADLIKRAIRDLYTPDIDNILVEGEDGYQKARDFMRMLMPSHSRRVHNYRENIIPLFFRYQVEAQINALHSPVVTLRSGGYIVINQTEALVAIDVNSGRSTRERNIEETAYRTNMEASEEVARQLRLRDLAGLIVIDFIDMEDGRNNAAVERRLKEAMRHDRARLQIGRISHFGLMELSRQRLRPSLLDLNFEKCPHCHGTGHIRLVESSALLALHAMEEEGIRQTAAEIIISMPSNVSLYIMNNKREAMASIEKRYNFTINIRPREDVIPPEFPIERIRTKKQNEQLPINQMMNEKQMFADMDRDMGLDGDAQENLGSMESDFLPADGDGIAAREGFDRFAEAQPNDNGSSFENGGAAGTSEERRSGRRRGRRGGRNRRNRFRDGDNRNRDNFNPQQPQFAEDGDGTGEINGNVAPPVIGVEGEGGQEFRQQREGGNRDGHHRRDGNRDRNRNRDNRHRDRNRDGRSRDGQPRDGNRDFRDNHNQQRNNEGRRFENRTSENQGNYNPNNRGAQQQQPHVPVSVFELDTTPREPARENKPQQAENTNAQPEVKKTGWWQRLTGAS
ncbi:MAG: Rne/Rng family ribonuclease [Alphaproteobacteria bacterium]|nr:Rne/Rng family ribonuclease [Alphaproteobacteria bacterium]